MAQKDISVKHVLRNDTRANWLLVNPILAKGELGIEIDTFKIKIGNGVDTYSKLPYLSNGTISKIETRKVVTTQENQMVYTIPFEDYVQESCFLDIRINSTWINPDRYSINGKTITFQSGRSVGTEIFITCHYLESQSNDDVAVIEHTHKVTDIVDFPTSLPANGGNADTVGGLSPSVFSRTNHNHDSSYASSNHNHDSSYARVGVATDYGTSTECKGSHGSVYIGMGNTSYGHYQTSATSGHWFDKNVYVRGEIYAGGSYNQRVYHSGYKPTPADIGASPTSHTHDDRYYTESEINTKLNSKANTSGIYSNITAGAINSPDVRSDNQPPSWYFSNHPKSTIVEFKYCSTIGLPSGSPKYCHLETHVPWSSSSGGFPTQIAWRDRQMPMIRFGSTNETWGAWQSLGGDSVIKSVQRGTLYGKNTVTISTVNPLKCMVSINGISYHYNNGNSSDEVNTPYVSSLTATQLTLGGVDTSSSSYKRTFSWEVVEFY